MTQKRIQDIKVAVDAVVFGYKQKILSVLLVKQKFGINKDQWVLPGGLVKDNETLNVAVQRELFEEAGIKVNYLEQLYTFGDDVNRDPRNRVISVSYFALINPSKMNLKSGTDAKDAQWFPLNDIPKLPFDHNEIIDKAINRVQSKLSYQPIGFELLDKEFPFSDLENLYQTILNKQIDRRNFRKKILSFELLKETNKMSNNGAGRPAKLFKFNQSKYNKLTKEGFLFEIK